MAQKLNIQNLDALLALQAPRRKQGNAATAVKGNRDARLVGVVTSAHESGYATLQGDPVLEGWTRVHRGKVVADVTPAMAAAILTGRSKRATERAQAGMDHDADMLGIVVIPSEGSSPKGSARLGGRFYVVDVQKLDAIDDASYANMIQDIDGDIALILTDVRPLDDAE